MGYIGQTPTAVPLVAGDITDGIISEAKLAADAVSLAKMKAGTDGNIISYDASGNPAAVATGSSGQVLTSAGAGAPPTFSAAPSHTGNVAFPATQSASSDANTLDDYEEGTFTIAQTFGSGSSAVASQFASYVKIGKWVFINAYYQNGSSSSPSGQMNVTGLPFTTSGGAYFHVIIWNTLASATGSTFFAQYSGGTSFPIWEETNSTTRAGNAGAYMNYHDGPYVGFNFAYQTA